MAKRRGLSKEARPFKLLLLGTALSLLLFFTTTLISAFITNSLPDPLGNIGIASIATLAVCALLSGGITSYFAGDGGVVTATLSSLLFSLIMLLIGFICTGGKLPVYCLINYGIFIATSALSAIITRKLTRKRKRRR